MKKLILVFVVFVSYFSFSQEKYEYVIIPSKFEFLDKNEYNLNALTKSFFETEGFKVYYDTDEFPLDLANNRCKAIYADAIENNNMFTTRITIQIKDCQNKIILESEKGSSREKSLQVAYNEVFRFALNSLKGKLNFKNDFNENKVVEITETTSKKVEVKEELISNTNIGIDPNQLKAVLTKSGYNLVNYANNIIVVIKKTSIKDVFIAESESYKNGVLLKRNGEWYLEYYYGNQFFSEKVNVRF